MKYLLLIFFFLFSTLLYSQNDYKLTTEGFKFEASARKSKKLKIYLSSKNIGANEPWVSNINDFILYQANMPEKKYIPISFIPVLSNESSINNSTYIPMDAYRLNFKYPKKFGGLVVQIPENSSSKQGNILKPHFTNYVGYGFSFDGGVFFASDSKFSDLGISLEILPKLFSFGKNKKSVVFATLGFRWGGIFGGINANKIQSVCKVDSSQYKITEQFNTDSSAMNYISYGGGLGIYYSPGNMISPMLSVSLINNTMIPLKMNITDKKSNRTSEFSTYSGLGFKIEAGVEIAKNFLIAYSFNYFKPDDRYNFLNKIHLIHNLKIALWGWA
jgi:hypothetical protein